MTTHTVAMVAEPGQIFIKTINGKTITLSIQENELVADIKTKVQEKEHIPADQQILTYKGKNLENDKTLDDYNIKKGDTLHLSTRLKGGVTEHEVTSMMNMFRDQLTQMQNALQEEKDKSEKLRKQVQ